MPLYNDLGFYTPQISPFSYTPSGLTRSINGYYKVPTPRISNINRTYLPMLKPINENPYKGKYVNQYSTAYVPPRPIQINTADIDVSASKFDINRHHRVRSTSPEVKKPDETAKESEYSDSKDFMPRINQNDPPQFRTTIKRCRPIVRLSTWRKRSISRSKSNSVEKRDSDRSKSSSRNSSVKERKSGGKKKLSNSNSSSSVESSDGKANAKPSAGTSWRDKLEDVLKEKVPKPVRKTPGELILERHIIRDNKKDIIERVPQIPKTIVEIPQTMTEQEITYLEPLIAKSIRKQSLKHCPSFKDICKDISSDIKANDDLNAGVLRRRASLIHEQEQQILAQFNTTRRLSSDIVNIDASIMEQEEESDQKDEEKVVEEEKPKEKEENKITIKKKTKAKDGKLKHKITVTVEVNNLAEPGDLNAAGAPVKKSPKWEAVVEEVEHKDHTHQFVKLPRKQSDAGMAKKHAEKVLKSESGVDFWKLIGRKASLPQKAPLLKLSEGEAIDDKIKPNVTTESLAKTNETLKTTKTSSNEIETGKEECSTEKIDIKTISIAENSKNKIEKISSGSSESGLKKVKKKKTTSMTQSESKQNQIKTITNENRTLTEKNVCTEEEKEDNNKSKQDTLYTKSLMQTNQLKITTGPTAKAPETKQKQIHGRDERGIEKSGNDVFDINETANSSKQLDDVNPKLKQEIHEKTDDDNKKSKCDQIDSPRIENAEKCVKKQPVAELPAIENENCDKVGNIASDEKNEHLAKSNTISTKSSAVQNDIFETNDSLIKYPTINDLSSKLSTSDNVDQTIISDAVVDDENCISGEESIDFLSSSDSDSERDRSSAGSGGGSYSGSEDEMGLKRRHKKKKKDQFDPKKVVKLDHSRKCYVVNEEPKYPLIATPKPLQKKYHFYSDSDTDDEHSYSDNDSSDEYYDEDVIKDVIRMSRCSNDSGFEGSGAVLTNPKKILGNYCLCLRV